MSQSTAKGIVRDAPGDPAQPKEIGQHASAKTKVTDRELSDAELDAVAAGASEDNGYGRSRG